MLARGALFIFRACPWSCLEGRWCPQPMWATAAIVCFRLLGLLPSGNAGIRYMNPSHSCCEMNSGWLQIAVRSRLAMWVCRFNR